MRVRIGMSIGLLAVAALVVIVALSLAPVPSFSISAPASAPPASLADPPAQLADSSSAGIAGSNGFPHPNGLAPVSFGGPKYVHGHPAIYLTYDDGPEPGSTDLVLKELKAAHVPGTFFVLGMYMQTPPEQQLIKDEYALGHSVSVHGFTHGDMLAWRQVTVRKELNVVKPLITALTGAVPTCFRPPYGSYGRSVLLQADRAQLRIQLWVGDTLDWEDPGADRIIKSIERDWAPGSVILLHDGRGHGKVAAQVTGRVVRLAAERGYRIGQLCPMRRT